MDKFDRIFQLHNILSSRRTPIPLEDLMARLECSKSTLHRAIATLKDRLNAPVVFDANAGGYKYGQPITVSSACRLHAPLSSIRSPAWKRSPISFSVASHHS
jgi:hypothetical protein